MEGTLSLFDWQPVPAGTAAASVRREQAGAVVEAVPVPEVVPVAVPGGTPERGRVLAVGSGPAQVAGAAQVAAPVAVAVAAPRILVFDCETTGTDRVNDQVIELCVQRGLDDGAPSQVWRIKPSVAIHPGAQAVHGISMAELEGCPAFAAVADEIAAVFADADVIVGYNLAFDIDMLQAEYGRIGRPPVDFASKQIVDAFRLWQQCEPRSLQHAHQRFVGNEFAAAHSASADVAATGRVLAGMLQHFGLGGHDWTQIAHVCDPGRARWLGSSRHLQWEGDIVVLGFGKHTGAALHELAGGPERSFLRWVCDRDFPPHVAEICRAALEHPGEAFLVWARSHYPMSAPPALPVPASPAGETASATVPAPSAPVAAPAPRGKSRRAAAKS